MDLRLERLEGQSQRAQEPAMRRWSLPEQKGDGLASCQGLGEAQVVELAQRERQEELKERERQEGKTQQRWLFLSVGWKLFPTQSASQRAPSQQVLRDIS